MRTHLQFYCERCTMPAKKLAGSANMQADLSKKQADSAKKEDLGTQNVDEGIQDAAKTKEPGFVWMDDETELLLKVTLETKF